MIRGISIDSRTIRKGEVFVAIKGRNFDGRDFIEDAVKKGASCIISNSKPAHIKKVPVVVVGDTVKALGDIAANHRRKFDIPVVGITGSNGKTTTKEIIAHILGARFKVLKNKGTENNFIGLPLTLLKLRPNHKAAVLEMGANHLGEIDRLSKILRPTLGVITNIGPSHLKYFGDLNTVFKAKSEILKYLANGSIVLNGDDEFLKPLKKGARTVTFGIERGNDFYAADVIQKGRAIEFKLNGKGRFKMNLAGMHNVYNALAGIAAVSILGIGLKAIKGRLATFKPLPMRIRPFFTNGFYVIDDTYNSNPLSSKCAVEFLSGCKTGGKKIFVAGDMMELGKHASFFHRELGRFTASYGIDKLIAVGTLSRDTAEAAKKAGMSGDSVWICPSTNEAFSILTRIISPGDAVLVKGSRAMEMEKVVENLKLKTQNL